MYPILIETDLCKYWVQSIVSSIDQVKLGSLLAVAKPFEKPRKIPDKIYEFIEIIECNLYQVDYIDKDKNRVGIFTADGIGKQWILLNHQSSKLIYLISWEFPKLIVADPAKIEYKSYVPDWYIEQEK
tara:strand:- start:282 stop:665 length:384 start_codon:yes stop_codon:yes gene_type:complete